MMKKKSKFGRISIVFLCVVFCILVLFVTICLGNRIRKHEPSKKDEVTVPVTSSPIATPLPEITVQEPISKEEESAFVQIKQKITDGVYKAGNGFILSLNDGRITLCTCAHVVSNGTSVDVIFYNGIEEQGMVSAMDQEKDIALIEVTLEYMTEAEAKKMVPVILEDTYWENILYGTETPVILKTKQKKSGKIIWPEEAEKMPLPLSMIKVSTPFKTGDSGSAIVTENGSLIGMANRIEFNMNGEKIYWCIRSDEIIGFYKKYLENR